MHSLLDITTKASQCNVYDILGVCADAMSDLVPDARTCYEEGFKYENVEFKKIMLVDGCFILELLSRSVTREHNVTHPIFIKDLD